MHTRFGHTRKSVGVGGTIASKRVRTNVHSRQLKYFQETTGLKKALLLCVELFGLGLGLGFGLGWREIVCMFFLCLDGRFGGKLGDDYNWRVQVCDLGSSVGSLVGERDVDVYV